MSTILLVDDSKMLLKHIERTLSAAGHEIVATSSGDMAVHLLATAAIDLVITDLYMPPPDGFAIVDAVRGLPQPPALVVMSSSKKACRIFRDARMLGAAAVLTKPFTAEQLLGVIHGVLGGTPSAAEPSLAPTVAASSVS